jgi:hypothetical protein
MSVEVDPPELGFKREFPDTALLSREPAMEEQHVDFS